jgi:hypothetical protein
VSRNEVTLSRPGGRDPRVVALNGIAVSWVVDDSGTASAEVASSALRFIGALPDPRGWELYWEHETLGPWWGEVEDCETSIGTGTTELAARTWDAALEKRVLPRRYDPPAAPAGSLLRRAANDVARSGHPLRIVVLADETGESLPLDQGGGDLADVLRAVERTADGGWRARHDARAIEWRRGTVGRDLRASVVLVEGRQVVDGSVRRERRPVVNEVTAVQSDRPFARAAAVVVRDEASVGALGLRQETVVYPGLGSAAALGPAARADLARAVLRGRSFRLDLTDARDDPTDRCFAAFREGDTVGVVVPSANDEFAGRVMVRAWDSERSILTVYGEVV